VRRRDENSRFRRRRELWWSLREWGFFLKPARAKPKDAVEAMRLRVKAR
jgi:hypothetical protein